GASATAGEQTQATITASQAGEVQGKISEISEGKAGIQGQRQVATGGAAGIGAKADVGPSGPAQAFRPASRDLRHTGTRGSGFGFTGASGARASAFGQTSRTSISPQVTQGGTAEVSSQISATKVGPKGAAVGAEEISQIGEEVLPQEEIKEPAFSQIEIGIPPEEGQPAEQVQPQTNVEISLPEERAAGEPGEMEEKIKVPKEYQEMIGKLGKGGADLERNVQGKSPEEGGFPKEAGEEEAGEEEPSKEGQEPEEGGIGKPLEYPTKEEPGGEEKPEKTPPRVKGEAPSEKAPKVDGIQRPKEGLGPKEGLPPDLGQEAPEKGAGEPLAGEVPKAGLPAAGAAAPAAEAAEAGAAAAPLAEGAAAGAAGGPMGMAAGAALAAAGSKGGLDAVASQAASPFLEQAALWVWGFAIPSFGLSVLLGLVVGDFIWIFKKKILNFRIKLHIVGMNLAVVLVVMILVLFFAVTMKYMCMNPLTYGTIWVSGNSDICKALEATTVQTLFSEPPAPLPPGTPCAPLFSGDASVNNLANSCFGGNSTKASAIAGAESGGIPTSESRTDRCTLDNKSVSIGLFQINISVRSVNGLDCKKAFSHPYDAQHKDCQVVNEGLYNQCVAAAKNSLININLACQISGNGANWSAWGANSRCGF
ncbi:MAG: hypothetical protein NTX98_01080, partial [Candidatus Doudnabacteria bacterium]|nr:hypothetical protein [Candidatus Doudnabacteria bacterium]